MIITLIKVEQSLQWQDVEIMLSVWEIFKTALKLYSYMCILTHCVFYTPYREHTVSSAFKLDSP